ncbi:MAG: hypothetical protein ACI4EG_04655 [Fusicatenibacter sp.]
MKKLIKIGKAGKNRRNWYKSREAGRFFLVSEEKNGIFKKKPSGIKGKKNRKTGKKIYRVHITVCRRFGVPKKRKEGFSCCPAL